MAATEVNKVVFVSDPSIEVKGIDTIWHNMDARSDFSTIRKWFRLDINQLYLKVGDHVRQGLYEIIAINASKHSFVVICATSKKRDEFPDDWTIG